MNVFIANVGEQDVWLNTSAGPTPTFFAFDPRGGAPQVREYLNLSNTAGARAIASEISTKLPFLRDRIILPILIPAIEEVLKRMQTIDRLILVGTDQPVGSEFHPRDTIESAKLIYTLVTDKFGSAIKCVESPIPCPVNPSRQDEANEFLRRLLLTEVAPARDLSIFASVKGGVPALNASLRQHVANIYGGQGHLVETEEPAHGSRNGATGVARLVSTWVIRRDAVIRLIREALNADNYEGATSIIASEGVADTVILNVLRHAHNRQNLNFFAAAQDLKSLTGQPNVWATSARNADDDLVWRLAEIFQTLLTCLHRGDYVGFLSRLESFVENGRRVACQLLSGMEINGATISVNRLESVNLQLAKELTKRIPSKGGQWKVGYTFYRTLMEVAGKLNGRQKEVNNLNGHLRGLQRLERLRHQVLHELAPISKHSLDKEYGDNIENIEYRLSSVLGVLRSFAKSQSKPLEKNTFADIKRFVLKRLETLSIE